MATESGTASSSAVSTARPAGQVRRGVAGGHEPAEVDDPPHARGGGGRPEPLRGALVALGEAVAPGSIEWMR